MGDWREIMNTKRILVVFAVVTSILMSGIVWSKPDDKPPEDPPPIEIDVNVVNTPDVNVVNTDNEPIPVEETDLAGERVYFESRGGRDCSSGTICSFVGTQLILSDPDFGDPIPEGKALLVETLTVAFSNFPNPPQEAIAAISTNVGIGSLVQHRHLIGEMIPTPGFTGADSMATQTNLNLVVVDRITAIVGFPNPNDRPVDDILTVTIYVGGLLVDLPPPPP
jgi:hypothetical protein